MPTPMRFYTEAARRFGKVDPTDSRAIENFFVETFKTLPKKKKEEIIRFLLSGEGSPEKPWNAEDFKPEPKKSTKARKTTKKKK